MKPLNYVFVQLEFAGGIIMSSTGNIILDLNLHVGDTRT